MKRTTKLTLCITLFALIAAVSIFMAAGEETGAQVPQYSLGDVDGDMYITAADARLVLRFVAKLDGLTEEQQYAADIDEDGEVTAADARMILRVVAKLEQYILVSNENELRQAVVQAKNSHAIVGLIKDIELVSNFSIPSEANITLTSAVKTMCNLISIRNMDVITVQENANLTIKNVEITRAPDTNGNGIVTSRNSSLVMNSGLISGINYLSGGTAAQEGQADVYNYGIFIMNGGTLNGCVISPGSFTLNGGTNNGAYTYGNASFTMNGGRINGDASDTSALLDTGKGTFTMNGGTINGDVGNGVHRTFVMNNGIINGHVSSSLPALTVYNGSINGGITFSGNNSLIIHNGTIRGGVLFSSYYSTFTLYDGKIYDGVINEKNGTFIMNGGAVSGNSGRGVSNGIGNLDRATFVMNGGTISGNSGGGVVNGNSENNSFYNSTFIMNGGTINNNNTIDSGGGIETSGVFTMNGGRIYNNIAGESGGGVNHTGGTFNFEGGWIYNNNASLGNDININKSGAFNNNVYDINIGAIGSPPPR